MIQQKPKRGFPEDEFHARMHSIQAKMLNSKLDAIVLTTEPHFRYFSGFFTPFWQSPTRPWFLVIPLTGKPIAVIPEIGSSSIRQTWIDDIRTWPSPQPKDDGISLLADTILNLPRRFARYGMTLGIQSTLRMPINDLKQLMKLTPSYEIADVALILHQSLSVKSSREIEKIHHVCDLVSASFEDLPKQANAQQSLKSITTNMRIDLLKRGVDDTPYMVAGCGEEGYESIILEANDHSLNKGDVFMIDTGSRFDGYFCDFDRNFALIDASKTLKKSHEDLIIASEAGFNIAKPGLPVAKLFMTMFDCLQSRGAKTSKLGRMGHGLGMQLTEWPSITIDEQTPLLENMVLTLEPSILLKNGKTLVHEENIVITNDGARWLTRPSCLEIAIIG